MLIKIILFYLFSISIDEMPLRLHNPIRDQKLRRFIVKVLKH